jgi:hypothetical protein
MIGLAPTAPLHRVGPPHTHVQRVKRRGSAPHCLAIRWLQETPPAHTCTRNRCGNAILAQHRPSTA